MSLENLGLALQDLAIFTAVRESALVYPAILSLHLACLGVFGGAILSTNLRLLRWAFTGVPLEEVVRRLRPWKYVGLFIMVGCGVVIAGSNASEYFVNPYFQTKMLLIGLVGVHGLVFRRTVYREPSRFDGTSTARVAAGLSLALWIGVLSMGRWIAYFD